MCNIKKLVILDSITNEVHIYDILPEVKITEDYLSKLGFKPDNCNWLSGDLKVIKCNTILTGKEEAPIALTHWQEWYWRKGGREKIQATRDIRDYNNYKNKIK